MPTPLLLVILLMRMLVVVLVVVALMRVAFASRRNLRNQQGHSSNSKYLSRCFHDT